MARTAGQKQQSEAPEGSVPRRVPTEIHTFLPLPEGSFWLAEWKLVVWWWLRPGATESQPSVTDSILQIAASLLQMKLPMKPWFPAEGLQLRVNCLQACTPLAWPFPIICFCCLCLGHGHCWGSSQELSPTGQRHRNPSLYGSFSAWRTKRGS